METKKTICLLIVEDVESDADLIVRLFEKAEFEVIHERVDLAELMRNALDEQIWDAVICDYRMPDFSAQSALSLLKESGLDLPFIVVSGTIGEDTAVAMMRYGAHDYLMKNNLARLVPAVEREMKEARNRVERKRTEAALNKQQKMVQMLMDNIPDFIYFKDIESNFLRINNSLAEKFKLNDPAEAVDKTDFNFFNKEHAWLAFEDERNIIRTGKSVVGLEEKETWLDGKETWVLTTKLPLRDEYGKIIGTFGLSRDITERKKMEEQIKADLKEKETLLKEVHHRVKNNLQIMSSLLNMQCQKTKDKKVLEIFKIYQGRIQAMALVHQMVYQNKVFSQIPMIPYINNMVQALSKLYLYDSKQIQIQVSGQDLCLDLNRAIPCGMILNELVSNAIKHAFPDGKYGQIRIDLREEEGSVYIEVADDGVPILNRFNVKPTNKLGMKIVSDLTEQLDGRFNVSTKNEFKVFTIEFMTDKA